MRRSNGRRTNTKNGFEVTGKDICEVFGSGKNKTTKLLKLETNLQK
jgi:hypothetical protein